MAIILFSDTLFRQQFPAFANTTTYPTATLQGYWDMGTCYINDNAGGCWPRLKLNKQILALNLMAAHLAALYAQINVGDSPGVTQAATIDKVTVTLVPPPVPNGWRYWLNQTPYGQQLLALLEVSTVGGFFYGGFPTAGALKR